MYSIAKQTKWFIKTYFFYHNKFKISGKNILKFNKDTYINKCSIVCIGNNNLIDLDYGVSLINTNIKINGNNCILVISKNADLRNIYIELKDNSKVYIGENIHSRGNGCCIFATSNCEVAIGKDCLFSHNVEISTSDYHSIFFNGEIINKDKSVIIGNHVWVSKNTTILKGSVLPDGCVIGANSLVNKTFCQENSIIAGCPAKIIKQGIRWKI